MRNTLYDQARKEGKKEGIKEGIKEGKQEGIQEEKTNMKNTIKTLENEGKTSDEILKTLKTTF